MVVQRFTVSYAVKPRCGGSFSKLDSVSSVLFAGILDYLLNIAEEGCSHGKIVGEEKRQVYNPGSLLYAYVNGYILHWLLC